MLALLAVFGTLGVGLMADAFLSAKATSQDDTGDSPDESEDEDTSGDDEGGSIFDYFDDPGAGAATQAPPAGFQSGFVNDGMPVSDDVTDLTDTSVRLSGDEQDDILNGGDADDVLSGGGGSDQLTGRDGDDVLRGGAGTDHLDGGAGDDRMLGGTGEDTMAGGDGDDTMAGGAGDDQLAGQEGDDLMRGGSGHDTLQGGAGTDTLDGGMGRDWLAGGEGDDLLVGGGSMDTLDGGDGSDTLWGGAVGQGDMAVDFLNGGSGDDVMHLGAGDVGTGGDGADSFVLQDIYPGGPMAEINDYNPDEDEIVVMYDPAVHDSPTLEVVPVEGSTDVTLNLDGVQVAMVRGGVGLDPAQVILRAA